MSWLEDLLGNLLQVEGTNVGRRRKWNFTGNVTATENAANDRIDISVLQDAIAAESLTLSGDAEITGGLSVDGPIAPVTDPADILDEFWDVNDARLRRDDSGDCVAILSRGNNQTAFKSTGAPPAVGTCPYTGRAMLVFDGSSNENLLASTGKVRLSSTTERTLWFLKRCTGITGSVQYIYTTTSNAEAIRITGSGGITSFYDGGNRSFGVTGNARLEAYCVRINSDGTMDLFRNGYKLATYDSTTVLPDDLTSKRVRIGANDAGSGNGWTGELHAWGWADSALTDAQILSLQRWVNHHYHKAGVRTLVPYTGGSTVMWFGDSITSTALSAGSDHYSYRTTVMAHLVGFEALGQLTTGTYTSPHEAVSGDDFDDATARIAAAASANPDPTYIVCALGTNDAAGAKTVTDEMSDFVTALAASFPSATILVPTIPPNTLGSNQTYIDTYHQNMWDEIDTLAGTGIDVIGVDISSTVTTDDVSGDGTHPDTTGHEKMGDAWIAFFEKRLGIA